MSATPTIRLAYFTIPAVRLALAGSGRPTRPGMLPRDAANPPAVLTSFVYLHKFLRERVSYGYRDWSLDSGAYSAWASGTVIDLGEYIRKCRELLATDQKLVEVFSLDVIGDWRASLKNLEFMWKAGVPAIPCYHIGEPWDVLRCLARDYPKIALGGVAKMRGKEKLMWAQRCMTAVWPKKVHGFGFGDGNHVLKVPFHSVDSTNWEIGPTSFGSWKAFNGAQLGIRGSRQNLRCEVLHFLELERKAQARWSKEMAELEAAA